MRVLDRDLRAELDMRADGIAKFHIIGQVGGGERGQVQLDESPPLLLSDMEIAVHADEMSEPELARKAVGAAKRLDSECGQVVDVLRFAEFEEWLEQ
jgi:hypothetical protein